MREPEAPCKDCKKRVPSCHMRCAAYVTFCEEREEWLATVRRNRLYFNDLERVGIQRSIAAKKAKGIKK